MSNARSTALRAGGACVRCRKGKTKCYYETGDPPCRNCDKGGHPCFLPSDNAPSPAPPRPSAAARPVSALPGDRAQAVAARHVPMPLDKITPEYFQECERVVNRTFPANIAFHKPSFIQQLKMGTLEPVLVYALLTMASRTSTSMIRRFGNQAGGAGPQPADNFAIKAMNLINIDTPSLADVQALALLVIHEWGSRNAVRAYVYLGQAARMLQMHRILGTAVPANDTERFHQEESIRRTLWLIYILDCMLTSTPGRRAALDPRDYADLSLPCTDVNFVFGNAVHVSTLDQITARAAAIQQQQQQPQQQRSPAEMDEHPPQQPQMLLQLHQLQQPLPADVGEFGLIVMGASVWRDVVHFLTALKRDPFDDAYATRLHTRIAELRVGLPMQFHDKPQQINLHIAMGSGFTYAMIHCLIHCANIFLVRRKMLSYIVPAHGEYDGAAAPPSPHPAAPAVMPFAVWRTTPQCHDMIQQLFTSCHAVVSLLNALDTQAEKDSIVCFPIYMMFSAFSASATIAYLSLKGLTPATSVETAANIVRDGVRFMSAGVETWRLMEAWLRHLSVMQRVLNGGSVGIPAAAGSPTAGVSIHVSAAGHPVHHHQAQSHPHHYAADGQIQDPALQHGSLGHAAAGAGANLHGSSPKDDSGSNSGTNPDTMDYEPTGSVHAGDGGAGATAGRAHSEGIRDESEPPVALPRRTGVTTISGGTGGTGGAATPATAMGSPTPPQRQQQPNAPHGSEMADSQQQQARVPLPANAAAVPTGSGIGPIISEQPSPPQNASQDMSPAELCLAFEGQLLDLDDLAAFMGGGV